MRLDKLVLAAIEYEMVPSPVPLPPDEIVIHEADAVAVQEHPLTVSTLTVPVVASAGTEVLTGDSANVQGCPGCVIVKV